MDLVKLVDALSQKNPQVLKKDVEKIIRDFYDTVNTELTTEGSFRLHNIATLEVRERQVKKHVMSDGKVFTTKNKHYIKANAYSGILDKLNGRA